MTINIFGVSKTFMHGKPAAKPEQEGKQLTIVVPQFGTLSNDDALNLAAWLVALADPTGAKFPQVLEEVLNS